MDGTFWPHSFSNSDFMEPPAMNLTTSHRLNLVEANLGTKLSEHVGLFSANGKNQTRRTVTRSDEFVLFSGVFPAIHTIGFRGVPLFSELP